MLIDLSIHQKLFLMSLTSLMMIVLIGTFSYTNTMQAIAMQNAYINDINPHLQTIRDFRRDANLESIAASEYVRLLADPNLNSHMQDLDERRLALEDARTTLLASFDKYSKEVDRNFPDERQYREILAEEINTHDSLAIDLINGRAMDETSATTNARLQSTLGELEQSRTRLLDALEAPRSHNESKLVAIKEELGNLGSSVLTVTAVLIIVPASITMIGGFYLYKSIGSRLLLMSKAVDAVRSGRIVASSMPKARESKDEISILCNHFEEMRMELQDKERLKEEFISIASHELRTPVQPILAYAQLGKTGKVNPEKAFNEICIQAIRLKNLANDILEVTRIDSGNFALTKEQFSINELIRDLVNEKKTTMQQPITLTLSLIDDRHTTVNADRARIIQVLSNLINNAIKFTKKGTIEVATSHRNGSYGRRWVEIAITDSGTGIPPEIIPKLFTKFASKSAGIGTESGTGLGLYISRAIVEAHNGTIAGGNNKNGPGATFTILLPYEEAKVAKVPDHNNGVVA